MKTLRSLCSKKIRQNPKEERLLFHYGPYYSYGHTFLFEIAIINTRKIANSRHMRENGTFEKWFRKMVNNTLDRMMNYSKDVDYMIVLANNQINKIRSFKNIFGIAEEVLHCFLEIRSFLYSMKL